MTEDNHSVLKAHLKYCEEKIHTLEDNVAKHERTKAEIADLESQFCKIQETIDTITQNQQQSFDNVSREVDLVSSKYEQTRYAIEKLKKENDELEYSIHCITNKELDILEKIKNLKCVKDQMLEGNNTLMDKLQKEQVILFFFSIDFGCKHWLLFLLI